jgi:hypothetical protein
MKIKTKLLINLYATLIVMSYMAMEWYQAAIANWLSIDNMPM